MQGTDDMRNGGDQSITMLCACCGMVLPADQVGDHVVCSSCMDTMGEKELPWGIAMTGRIEEDCSKNKQELPVVAAEIGVVGIVTYDVHVDCPHCGKTLYLNKYPYNDDQTDFSLAEDELGLALFGTIAKPAKWNGMNIEYTCCQCRKKFLLTDIDI